MYDTLNLWAGVELAKGIDIMANIPNLLSNAEEKKCRKTGATKITGNLENLKVIVRPAGIYISGSICKFGLGDNQQTLTRKAGIEALNNLSYALGLPVEQAKITRIDVAENIIVKYPESVYYNLLGDASHYNRLPQNNGIYYNRGKKVTNMQMLFYGKVYEQLVKGIEANKILADRNVLRYELRFLKRIAGQFKRSEILAAELFTEALYIEILNRWRDEYFKINKHNKISFNSNTMNSLKEFDRQIYLLGLMALGGEAEALEIIESAKKQGMYNNKMQAGRLKAKVKSIFKAPQLTEKSEAIQELDKKIKEAVRHYR